MRRSLLNKLNTPKTLRQALILITLLLLPSTAWGENYPITVAGVQVTDANAGNITSDDITGSVTFASTGANSGTLTLNNASITTGIESSLDNLTIKLVGNNTVNSAASNGESGDNYAIHSNNNNATLTIERNEANANTKLELHARRDYSIIGGFASISYGEGGYQTYLSSPDMPAGYNNREFKGYKIGEYLTNASITSTVTYPIWVSNRQITPTNLGTDHYTYIEDGSILQLSGINIEQENGFAICSDVESLKVKLVGENSINITYPFYSFYNGNATISFTTDSSNPGSLTLTAKAYNDVTNNVITEFTNSTIPTVENGLVWQPTTTEGKITSATISTLSYGLTVAGVAVTSANAGNILDGDNNDKVSFTPANEAESTPATLTLTGATINGDIVWNTDNALTIQLTGASTIDGYISSNKDVALTFTYPDGSNNSYLTVGGNAVSKAISGFNSVTLAEGLSYEENAFYNSNLGVPALQYYHDAGDVPIAHISYDYGLSVAGVEVRSTNKDNVLNDGGKVKFTPATPATLTLTDATINGGITWNTDADLTVEIIGSNNTITTSSGSCFNSTHSDKTISFTRGDTNNASKLVLNASTYHVISGFSNYEAPTVTGMFWIPTKDIFSNYIISATITSSLLGGGAGTESSPLVISTFDHLKDFATYVNIGTLTTEYVQLADNLDCSGKTGFEPIGNGSNPFKGTFDGNNKTISGLEFVTNDGPDFAGLFGKLDHESGLIKDLTLSGCTFKGGDCAGAIVAYLSKGTIQDCEVNSCIIETGNPQSPSCGGIVGTIQKGVVSNCTVNGGTITASTTYSSSPGNSFAGGIVGRYYLYAGNKISGCEVKGNVTITSSHAEATSSLSAGAIIGGTAYGDGPSLEDLDFSSNYYYSTVTTSTKKANDAAVVKNGNIKRGIGDSNDIIENSGAMLAGTKSITIGCFVDYNDASSYYYSSFDEENEISTVLDLPENNTVICLSLSDLVEAEGSTAKFTITNASTNKEIDATIEDVKEDNVYSYTKISFTMPDADVTIAMDIFAIPVSLSELGFVDENQTSSTYFSTEKNWNVPEGIVAYVITGISGSNVITSRVSSIPKGVPVFLEKGSSTEEPKDNSNNILYGTVEATDVTSISGGTVYVLYNNMFVKSTSGTIPAHRCYLLIGNSVATTRGFGIDHGDGTSGISEVKSGEVKGEKRNGEWFDLQGRRLPAQPVKPGLYIHKDKKVVIK